MIIPLRTDRQPRRRPIVTEGLIIINMLIYLAGLGAEFWGLFDRQSMVAIGHLVRGPGFRIWQLITYQFLHDPGAVWHLAFNMLFLWVFGCAVEDRLGRASFASFYLAGGVVAGLGHMLFSAAPVIGASGAIAGVSGAFLALFPRSRIQVLVIFLIIGVFAVPSLWFIGFYFVIDLLRQTAGLLGGGGHRVAYMAHLAGYVYGFALAFALLATGVLPRGEFDVFFLFKQARRRAAFRATGRRQVGGLWESAPANTAKQIAEHAKRSPKSMSPVQGEEAAARAEIAHLITARDLPAAAAKYARLLGGAKELVFSEGAQLDLANQLHAEGEYELAARAYELLLKHHPACAKGPEVKLMLAVIYTRRVVQLKRARELIEQARPKLSDTDHKALADQLMAEMGA